MSFLRRKSSPAPDVAPPPPPAPRDVIGHGWSGLPWGATVADFTAKFPIASRQDSGWWTAGGLPDPFCGLVMITQYAFTGDGRLYLAAFYPELPDRDRLAPAVTAELGPPDGPSGIWTLGDVRVEVKQAGVAATLTHLPLAAI